MTEIPVAPLRDHCNRTLEAKRKLNVSKHISEGIRLGKILALTLAIALLGCSAPKRGPVVVNENTFLQCESSRAVESKMVALINHARSSTPRCGQKRFLAVKPVRWNPDLARVALNHSMDMANHDFLSHKGSNGSSVEKRVREAGYAWRSVGENISGGRETSEQVVSAWLNSVDHCDNIMNPSFTEIGVACFRNSSSKYGTYWTLVLASPRE
ncbi:MAG: CAP domain-containing protein [Proteobacteria bacterium]|nr:CAP domain-containing protein [Pseudomonadota bacterium]NIS68585.1 CAP domain-containing protein [Pseudomonadota bacterium]